MVGELPAGTTGDHSLILSQRIPREGSNVLSILAWNPTGQRITMGCLLRGCTESDMKERPTHMHFVSPRFSASLSVEMGVK